MLFLGLVLAAATALLCYAGYVFLIVDKREAAKEMEEPELFEELDMKEYFFELPEAVDTFEELRATNPSDKRTLPMALLIVYFLFILHVPLCALRKAFRDCSAAM